MSGLLSSWLGIHERPEGCFLTPDQTHPLRKGLVFLGAAGGYCQKSLRFHDSAVFGNHGTLTNMDPATDWVWDNTLNRFALDFDGTNDYVVTSSIDLTPFSDIALSFWLYYTTWPSTFKVLFELSDNYNSYPDVFGVFAADGGVNRVVCRDTTKVSTAEFSPPGAGSWHHFFIEIYKSRSTNDAMVFIDGADATTGHVFNSNPGGTFANKALYLGSRGGVSSFFACRLSDVMLFSGQQASAFRSALADPSNVMLSGLILPPARRLWAAAVAAPPTGAVMNQFQRFNLGADLFNGTLLGA